MLEETFFYKGIVMSQWFAEGNSQDGQYLAVYLAQHGIGDENKFEGIMGSDGRPHDVWLLPGPYVRKVLLAKQIKRHDPIFKFRFWKRNLNRGKIYPADFIEIRKDSAKVKEILDELARKQ